MSRLSVLIAMFMTTMVGAKVLGSSAGSSSTALDSIQVPNSLEVLNDSTVSQVMFDYRASDLNIRSYLVGLRNSASDANYCAGVLVAPSYVLTSNLCVPSLHSHAYPWKQQWASIGSIFKDDTSMGEQRRVLNLTPHPQYNKATRENDFLLLQLLQPSSKTPVVLPEADSNIFIYGKTAIALGWGTNAIDVSTTTMSYVGAQDCTQTQPPVFASQQCAVGAKSTDAYDINEGSPLIMTQNGKDVLVGIVSNNAGCDQTNVPALLSRVPKVRDLIKKVVGV